MAVDTSVSPYFDDFNENKNYVRVLYKPGVAVQARELTQSQTILQNQIKSVGNFLFRDGAKVTGPKPVVNIDARAVKLKPTTSTGAPLDVKKLLNTFVTGENSEVIGLVEAVFEADNPIAGDPNTIIMSLKRFNNTNDGSFDENTALSFYLDYTDALTGVTPNYTAVTTNDIVKNSSTTLSSFSSTAILDNPSVLIKVGDLLVHPSLTKKIYVTAITSTTQLELSENPGVTFGSENVSYVTKATNPTSIVTQDAATFYKKGYFVKCTNQSIVPDKRTNFPTKLIALLADEQIITSDDDNSLLDPALESSNYFAPGADRLKVDLNLASLDVIDGQASEDSENLIPLIFFNQGRIEYIAEISNDAELDKKLAERTYDESGSYVVTPFQVSPVNTVEEDTELRFSISPGKAYVGGLVVRTIDTTSISVPKVSTTETKTSYNINTTYGNYFRVANVRNSLTNPADLEASSMFMELHNVARPVNANTLVGYISYKNLEYDTYIGGDHPQYKIFYHSYSPVKEVPATWDAWSVKYGISIADGQYIANVLYTNNDLLGTFGVDRKRYYGLFREPDTGGVAFWQKRWVALNRDIAKVKEEFALAIPPAAFDYSRVTSNTKSFAQVVNGSVFYDGLINVKQIRSIVGVRNELTQQGTAATYASPFFYADIAPNGIDISTGETIIFDRDRPTDCLIYPLNKTFVKNVDKIQSLYNKVIKNAVFAGGLWSRSLSFPETFAIGDGTIPPSTARANFTVIVKSGATANTKLGAFNFENGSVVISGDSGTVTIDLGDPTFTGVADVSITVENDDVQPRVKTLSRDNAKLLDIKLADFKYSLLKSDIVGFGGIHKLPNVGKYQGAWTPSSTYTYEDVVFYSGAVYLARLPSTDVAPSYANVWTIVEKDDIGNYILDNGQRDSFYDHGGITYIGRALPPGNVIVTFDYYTHSGDGPAVVQSYPADSYSRIPIYRSVIDSTEYNLRDCIDFRPRRIDDSIYQDYDAAIIPNSSITTEADVTYFLGRKDKIYVTNNLQNFNSPYNKFFIELGKETADNPVEKTDTSDLTKLSIATLEIPPFASSAFDVKITYEENKRFTMRDIAKLESLTYQLDKAVKLQAIEIASLKSTITNSDGDSLLKSGILIENFKDFDTADLTSGYFNAAIDTDSEECFPTFGAWNIDLGLVEDTDIFLFNDIITKKYTEELYVSNLEANEEIFVNPGGIDDGKGRAILSKQNSFRINPLLTGGLLVAGYIAAKTAAAFAAKSTLTAAAVQGTSQYALLAAWQGESIMGVAWGAAKELGYTVLNAFKTIDGVLEMASWPYKAIKTGAEWIYSSVSGNGATSLLPTSYGSGSVVESLFGSAAWGSFSEGATLITDAMANIFNQPFSATASGLQTGVGFITSGLVHATWGQLSVAANSLATASTGVPILSTATSAIASGISSSYAWLAAQGPLIQVVAVVALVYVAVKVVQKVWKFVKKLFSDERMKENIVFKKKMPNGLNLYEFEYKKEFKSIAGHGRFEGYIAQEVEKKYPKAVQIESNGFKSINYSMIGT
jgi:hypothetical protein